MYFIMKMSEKISREAFYEKIFFLSMKKWNSAWLSTFLPFFFSAQF